MGTTEPSLDDAPPGAGPPLEGDLSSYIAARRRARGETESSPSPGTTASVPVEDDIARRDRIVASNLASPNSQAFGEPPKNSGGIFGITRIGYTDAEFTFFGWNKDIRRNTTQLIEVRKGANSDIRLAVVRRMIVIIREHENADFVFESRRLGRNVTLSARPRDTAGLEDFMMREFFGDANRP